MERTVSNETLQLLYQASTTALLLLLLFFSRGIPLGLPAFGQGLLRRAATPSLSPLLQGFRVGKPSKQGIGLPPILPPMTLGF